MVKARNKEPPVVSAILAKDPKTGEWTATTEGEPHISARALQIRRARDHLTAKLRRELGRDDIIIEERVKLPKALAAQVEEFQKDLALETKLRAKREQSQVVLAKALLSEHLQARQVARILGVSKSWLSQFVGRDTLDSD